MTVKTVIGALKHLTKISCCLILCVTFCAIGITNSAAATFVLDNLDGPNEGFNDNSPAIPNQTNNSGNTLGQQRLAVFQAAADFWGERLISDVVIRVSVNMDPLFCSANSATLGSAGPQTSFRNFTNAPRADTFYPVALANSIAGRDLAPNANDIRARFNVDIDNNNGCLSSNWWLGINSPSVRGTISLFDTVLHEIGHGLGVVSLVNSSTGRKLQGLDDTYSLNLFDEQTNEFWSEMTDAERVASAINTGNLVWRGENADTNSDHLSAGSLTNGHIRMFAPNPLQQGSSVSHWDTALSPNELMEPSLNFSPDSRSTFQLLRDIGWGIIIDGSQANPGQIGFNAQSFSVIEDAGPARITLARSGGSDGAVSVRIRSEDISATGLGTDYNTVDQFVNWADGETGTRTINVTVVNDGVNESDETARFRLSNATGGATIEQSTTILTIEDPAPLTPSTLSFVGTPFQVAESTGRINIRVRRSGNTVGAVSVTANTSNITALGNGVDYNSIINQTLNWADGEQGERSFTVTVTADFLDESNEQLRVSLGNVIGNAELATNSTSAVVTILDSNEPPSNPGQIGFTTQSFSVIEDAGPARITLARSGGSDGPVSVRVRSQGITARVGSDYNAVNQVVNWGSGETGIRVINVTVINDGLDEDDETTRLNLTDVTGGATIEQATTILTIQDPAPLAPSTLSFVGTPFEVAESTGRINIRVRRSGSNVGAVSVRATSTNIEALGDGVDYNNINQTLSWASGEQGERSFTVIVNTDLIDEPNERFRISLSNVIGNAQLATSSSSAVVTIVDSNSPSAVPTPGPDAVDDDFLLNLIVPMLSAVLRNRELRTQQDNANVDGQNSSQ